MGRVDTSPIEGWLSRSLDRKSMKGTKGKKDPEGIEASTVPDLKSNRR
jgi:hypothetical protein